VVIRKISAVTLQAGQFIFNLKDFKMNKDFYDIIAVRFDNIILLGQTAIDRLKIDKKYTQLISRLEFKMFSRMDFGDKWRYYAEFAPTLFTLTENTDFEARFNNTI
jgi:hypothetical protein